MALTIEDIRTTIAKFKKLAESVPAGFDDAEQLAIAWFIQEESFHDDWDILMPEVKEMWIQMARYALKEITTGELTP